MVRRMRADDAARAALFELVDDPTVHLLLSLHGIVRPDPITQANRVLESVRPQLHSHGGDVSLVRVEDGTAFVRLEGACNGCSMSSVTLRNLVEEALVQGVPSISAVEVLPNEPTPTLIPLESLRDRSRPRERGLGEGEPGRRPAGRRSSAVTLTTATGEAAEVIVVNAGQRLTAYRNECAHEALPLNNAMLDLWQRHADLPVARLLLRRDVRGVPERPRGPTRATAVAGRRGRRLGPRQRMSRYTVRHNMSGVGTRPDVSRGRPAATAGRRHCGWAPRHPAAWRCLRRADDGLDVLPARCVRRGAAPGGRRLRQPPGADLARNAGATSSPPTSCSASRTARPRATPPAGADPSGA